MEIKDMASRITLKSSVGTAAGDVSLFGGGVPRPADEYESTTAEYDGTVTANGDGAEISYNDSCGICRIVCADGKLFIERANRMEIVPGKVTYFKYKTPLGELEGAALGASVDYALMQNALTVRAEYYSEIKGTDVQSVKIEIEAKY